MRDKFYIRVNNGVIANIISGDVSVACGAPKLSRGCIVPDDRGPTQGTPTQGTPPIQALEDWLCMAFTCDEFHQFLYTGGYSSILPHVAASPLALSVHDAVSALIRRDNLDVGFFRRLVHARPTRHEEIRSLASSFGATIHEV